MRSGRRGIATTPRQLACDAGCTQGPAAYPGRARQVKKRYDIDYVWR